MSATAPLDALGFTQHESYFYQPPPQHQHLHLQQYSHELPDTARDSGVGFRPENIDDIIYRYSAELDRGTPTEGIYARDGLWDDDEVSDAHTAGASSGSASTINARKSVKSVKSIKSIKSQATSQSQSRSRSGTVSSVTHPDERKGMFSWGRKSPYLGSESATPFTSHLVTPHIEEISEKHINGLKKVRSRATLKGKGRNRELSIMVDPNESFDVPPPLPPTPASFITNSSPALSTASFPLPMSYPSRPNLRINDENAPQVGTAAKAKSTWKRGVEKLFRSKSSQTLRDAFQKDRAPPVPGLPKPVLKSTGKPFSASTPPAPLGETRRANIYSYLSPPHTASSDSFSLSTHPSLPLDPFASSLDLSSNTLPRSSSVLGSPRLGSPLQPTRPRLSRHSPSLRDLKSFFPSKPTLSKAKSLANLRAEDSGPLSAPPERTEFFPSSKLAWRMSSVIGLSSYLDRHPPSVIHEVPSPLPTPGPVESPPLLPPKPPFSGGGFPRSTSSTSNLSSSTPVLSIDTSGSAKWASPPSSPLPPLPSSASSYKLNTVQRSASGAVLLPRSRSTSMSLKAPPTSSSFFDLYEQLGIWPTPDKDKSNEQKPADRVSHAPESPIRARTPEAAMLIAPVISESPSATFSAASWEAHVNAFPLIDDPISVQTSLEFPEQDTALSDGGLSEVLSTIAVAATSPSNASFSKLSTSTSTTESAETTRASHSKGGATGSSSFWGGSGRPSGSGGSSSRSSRRTSVNHHTGGWFHGGVESSSESEDEQDDVPLSLLTAEQDDRPLSQLHPHAAQAQRVQRRTTKKCQAAKFRGKVMMSGRNPGEGTSWDGEGGVPADMLRSKLEKLLKTRESPRPELEGAAEIATISTMAEPVAAPQMGPPRGLPPQRSLTDPSTQPPSGGSRTVVRSHTNARPSSRHPEPATRPPPSALLPAMLNHPVDPSHTLHPNSLSPSTVSAAKLAKTESSGYTQPPSSKTLTRQSTKAERHRAPDVARGSLAAPKPPLPAPSLRARAQSSAVPSLTADLPHTRSVTEPLPSTRPGVKVTSFINTLNGRMIELEIHPETTAKDVLSQAYARGEIGVADKGLGWVVVEIFAEVGCERQVREYEPLASVIRGWDKNHRGNCFILRQSNGASSTWVRNVPTVAPFLGAFVQLETKKGKWSKRYLETRGGQLFLAKNEKNKEEIHINTIFFDVHVVTRQMSSPKPFVFVIKRLDPAASFENPNEYMYTLCAEEGTAWKLVSAIYDARSYTLATMQPHLLAGSPGPQGAGLVRRHSARAEKPLVDLHVAREKTSAFTGKGLLKV